MLLECFPKLFIATVSVYIETLGLPVQIVDPSSLASDLLPTPNSLHLLFSFRNKSSVCFRGDADGLACASVSDASG